MPSGYYKRTPETIERLKLMCKKNGLKKGHKINVGRKMTDNCRLALGLGRKGKDHPSWKGGVSEANGYFGRGMGYSRWRGNVFTRDNFTCQRCGKNGGKLNAHHINNYSECKDQRLVVDNGITFCEDCHKLFHKIYGKLHNTIEQVKNFLLVKI